MASADDGEMIQIDVVGNAENILSPGALEVLLLGVGKGLPLRELGLAIGLSSRQLDIWRNEVDAGIASADVADLIMRMAQVELEMQERYLRVIEDAATIEQKWSAAAWMLERRFPKTYSTSSVIHERNLDAEQPTEVKGYIDVSPDDWDPDDSER